MNDFITINGYDFRKRKLGVTEYKVSAFLNDKLIFQFNLSLQPSGKDDILPTYQLTDKKQTIPEWTTENLNIISDWITKESK